MGSGDIMEGVNYGTYAQAVGQGGGGSKGAPTDTLTGPYGLFYVDANGTGYVWNAQTGQYVPLGQQQHGTQYAYTTPGGFGYSAQSLAATNAQYKDVANLYG